MIDLPLNVPVFEVEMIAAVAAQQIHAELEGFADSPSNTIAVSIAYMTGRLLLRWANELDSSGRRQGASRMELLAGLKAGMESESDEPATAAAPTQ